MYFSQHLYKIYLVIGCNSYEHDIFSVVCRTNDSCGFVFAHGDDLLVEFADPLQVKTFEGGLEFMQREEWLSRDSFSFFVISTIRVIASNQDEVVVKIYLESVYFGVYQGVVFVFPSGKSVLFLDII